MQKGILIILDGYGEGKPTAFNAVVNANTPTLNKLKTIPHSLLKTHGEAVGLFEKEMGGSEVGHTTIGAGRVVYQELARISKSIEDGDFFNKKEFLGAIENCKKNNL